MNAWRAGGEEMASACGHSKATEKSGSGHWGAQSRIADSLDLD